MTEMLRAASIWICSLAFLVPTIAGAGGQSVICENTAEDCDEESSGACKELSTGDCDEELGGSGLVEETE